MSMGIVVETLNWLLNCPSGDGNFKNHLASANEATIRAALGGLDDNETTKKTALERGLKKLLKTTVDALASTNDHHSGVLKMDAATFQAEREDDQQRQAAQAEREQMIAQCHEVIGRIQSNLLMNKFTTVSNLIHLKQIKETKIYRDLPGVGTWDKYCNYIGLSRQKVDEDLANLSAFGEDFLLTSQQFGLGYREMRKLRQLTHDGSVAIDGDCLCIADEEPIPIDQDHAEDLQAAIERIITAGNEIKDRNKRLERDFKGAVKEEIKGYELKEKTLLKEVERLKAFDPAEMDDSRFEEQYKVIHDSINTLACQIGKLVMIEGLHENPLVAAKVEAHIASAERLVEDLRRDWTAKFQIF